MANTEISIYAAGDQVEVAGDQIILTNRKRFSGGGEARWGWLLVASETGSARTFATADEAIADATVKITGPRCYCGEIATMNGSNRPTCDNHYAA